MMSIDFFNESRVVRACDFSGRNIKSNDRNGIVSASHKKKLMDCNIVSLLILFYCLPDMRRDVQDIFRMTPHEKQVMMFSATLAKDIRPVCKKFMQDVNIPLHHLTLPPIPIYCESPTPSPG